MRYNWWKSGKYLYINFWIVTILYLLRVQMHHCWTVKWELIWQEGICPWSFPFSYSEFLAYSLTALKVIKTYIQSGGMRNILTRAWYNQDRWCRWYVVRNNIEANLSELALYLISNVGKPASANKLSGTLGIKSPTTVSNYFAFLKTLICWIFTSIQLFHECSDKKSKKVYVMNLGFIEVASASFQMI